MCKSIKIMAKYNFEGDLENITERQLEFINNVILKHGLANSKVIFEPVGKAGDNYVANVKRIKIDGPNGRLEMIAKIASPLQSTRQTMNIVTQFQNEHIMYTEILPKLLELQKNIGVPEKEQLRYAKCYGSFTEQPHEVILLEDLRTSGFVMLNRFAPLTNDCVKFALKNLAVFHSLSFVLKHNDPEKYCEFKSSLIDIWAQIAKSEEAKPYFQSFEDETLAILEDPLHINFLRHKITNILNLATKFSKTDDKNEYTVIQHGDSWTNNIMFKFEGTTLIDSVMIDYQSPANTSPVSDLIYMIFSCTDYETRIRNFNHWIDYYHSELDKSLSNFSLKAELLYPRERLDADLKEYSGLHFGRCIMLGSILAKTTDDAVKTKEAMKNKDATNHSQEFLISSFEKSSKTRFKNIVVGLIESFTELGLL